MIHRGLIIATIQALFSLIFYYITIPTYAGLLMTGYTTIFNNFPIFCLMADEDVNEHVAMRFSPLYKSLQKGRSLSIKTFFIWVWMAIFQGSVIFLATIYFFYDAMTNIVTITFSALIIVQQLDINSCLTKHTWYSIGITLLTIITYIIFIAFMKETFEMDYITWPFILKIVALVLVCWLPFYITKKIQQRYYPNDYQKIMRQYHFD